MQRHLVIAGTGRAGTSFLVQYLTACGLETHLTLHPDARLDEHANAGLEDAPIDGAQLPYVIKSPWLYEFVDRIFERDDIGIDAVVMPMRNIVEAASSRVTNELRGRLGRAELDEEHTRWETWGTTAGGVVYSLNPLDQARILAMGFHHVVHACVRHRIPIVFLDFPTIIDDAEYLFAQMKPVFGAEVDREKALVAHAKVARSDRVRVGSELAGSPDVSVASKFPALADLDRAALYREIKTARRIAEAATQHSDEQLNQAKRDVAALRHSLAEQQTRYEQLHAQMERDASYHRQETDTMRSRFLDRISEMELANSSLKSQMHEVLNSNSWKIMAPVRKIVSSIKPGN